jgi:hypothetical protein
MPAAPTPKAIEMTLLRSTDPTPITRPSTIEPNIIAMQMKIKRMTTKPIGAESVRFSSREFLHHEVHVFGGSGKTVAISGILP